MRFQNGNAYLQFIISKRMKHLTLWLISSYLSRVNIKKRKKESTTVDLLACITPLSLSLSPLLYHICLRDFSQSYLQKRMAGKCCYCIWNTTVVEEKSKRTIKELVTWMRKNGINSNWCNDIKIHRSLRHAAHIFVWTRDARPFFDDTGRKMTVIYFNRWKNVWSDMLHASIAFDYCQQTFFSFL